MQAVLLPNENRLARDVNTFLRAFGIAQLAADAPVGHEIPVFRLFRAAEGKGGALDRRFGKVEPLPDPLADAEHGQRAAGGLVRIDLRHIRVLGKQVGQPARADLLRPALHRDRHAGHGILAFHGGKRDMRVLLQTAVKAFALCRQEIQAVFVTVHHVDRAGDGAARLVHGRKHG